MRDQFDKRIFTAGRLVKDVGFLMTRFPWMIGVARNKDIDRALVEKIMTVTTAVNGCTYCAWYHARAAVASGLSAREVQNLLSLQFHADASEFELVALLYAQHFAETNRQPAGEMTIRLFDAYGEKTAKHILLIIRMISFGNLLGNTWDAVLSRFAGKPAPQSNVVFELVFFVLTFWFMFPGMWAMRRDETVGR